MANIILKGKNLTKLYSSEKSEVAALDNLNLEIYKGEYAAIMGPSGSGKSTLLHVLSGLDSLSDGAVFINNNQINTMSEKNLSLFRREEIGFIFQAFNLVPNLTVLENILISGFLTKVNRTEIKNKAFDLLNMMEIPDLADRMPSEISGGEKQRAAIARALINSPSILFADEPTGNLNSASTANVLDIFSKINQNKQTIITVTHELQAACRADRVLYIKDGRINDIYTFSGDDTLNNSQKENELFNCLSKRGW